ncbi:MAG: hypothetical protein ACK5QT_04545 [Oligoflexia bacterium]
MKSLLRLAALPLALALCGTVSSANSGQSTQTPTRRWYDDIRLGTFGWAYGPALSQLSTGRASTINGNPGNSPITITQQLNLNAPAHSIGKSGDFRYTFINFLNWTPVAQPQGTSLLTVDNPWLGFAGTHLDQGSTQWWARYEAAAALTSRSRDAGMLAAVRTVQIFTFTLDRQKKWTFWPVLVPEHRFVRDGSSNSLFLQPNLTYAVNDRLSLGAFIEAFYIRPANSSILNWQSAMDSTLALSPTFRFKNGAFFQPFLNFYTGTAPSINTAHLGFYFGGRIL